MTTRITEVRISRQRTALREPFVTALREVTAVESVLVLVRDSDGMTGIGEAVPTPPITGETRESIEAALAGPLRDAVVGMRLDEIDDILARISAAMVGNTSAKAGLDIALHDLWARSIGVPLHLLLGGMTRNLVTDVTISLASEEQMADAALRRVNEGFSRLKLKLGGLVDDDFRRARTVRGAVGSDVALHIDANQGWSTKQAIILIRRIEDAGLDVALIEQPVPARDLAGLALVTSSVTTEIMADESCFTPEDALELIRWRAADAVNIKLMKSGGIRAALILLGIARTAGMHCSVGSMMEGVIATTAAACLAGARSDVTGVDLDAPLWLMGAPVTGTAIWEGEEIHLVDLPGLGFEVPSSLVTLASP